MSILFLKVFTNYLLFLYSDADKHALSTRLECTVYSFKSIHNVALTSNITTQYFYHEIILNT